MEPHRGPGGGNRWPTGILHCRLPLLAVPGLQLHQRRQRAPPPGPRDRPPHRERRPPRAGRGARRHDGAVLRPRGERAGGGVRGRRRAGGQHHHAAHAALGRLGAGGPGQPGRPGRAEVQAARGRGRGLGEAVPARQPEPAAHRRRLRQRDPGRGAVHGLHDAGVFRHSGSSVLRGRPQGGRLGLPAAEGAGPRVQHGEPVGVGRAGYLHRWVLGVFAQDVAGVEESEQRSVGQDRRGAGGRHA
mmetsp:Transcript_83147/g.232234  ORF Transcript_83147/g.232234 Transcript_83147/m.232234 type:complete len:244 (-) Transcript_83147:1085-1816(-)